MTKECFWQAGIKRSLWKYTEKVIKKINNITVLQEIKQKSTKLVYIKIPRCL